MWVHTWMFGGVGGKAFFPPMFFVPHKNKNLIICIPCPEWSFHPTLLHYVFESVSKRLPGDRCAGGWISAAAHSAAAAFCQRGAQLGLVLLPAVCVTATPLQHRAVETPLLCCCASHPSSSAAAASAPANLSTGYQQSLLHAFTQS